MMRGAVEGHPRQRLDNAFAGQPVGHCSGQLVRHLAGLLDCQLVSMLAGQQVGRMNGCSRSGNWLRKFGELAMVDHGQSGDLDKKRG
jgi:hypothetical protein